MIALLLLLDETAGDVVPVVAADQVVRVDPGDH
jgi:hypothetical protein